MTSRDIPSLLGLLSLAGAAFAGFGQEGAALALGLTLLWVAPIALGNQGASWRIDAKAALALGWMLWLSASQVVGRSSEYSQVHVYSLLLLPVIFLAWRHWREADRAWSSVMVFLGLFGGMLALWGILEGPERTYVGKPDGPYIDPNVYAATLNLFWLPLTAVYLRPHMPRARWHEGALLLVLGLIAMAFFMSSSRGAGLAALLLLPWIFWHARKQSGFSERALKWLFLTAYGYLLASACVDQGLVTRLGETTRSGDPARLMLWRSTWDMILVHPWLGAGFGSFRFLYPLYRDPAEVATGGYWTHNDYLQLWQEGGVVTLAFVVAIAWILVREAWRALRQDTASAGERLGLMAGCLAVFMHASVNFLLYFPVLNLFIGLYWARVDSQGTASRERPTWPISIRPVLRAWAVWLMIIAMGYHLLTSIVIQSNLLLAQEADQNDSRWLSPLEPAVIANWLSILRPDAVVPHLTLAFLFDRELTRREPDGNGLAAKLFKAADEEFDAVRVATPCHLPLAIFHIEFLLRQSRFASGDDAAGKAIRLARANLACHPRHGLSSAYLALAYQSRGDIASARNVLRTAYPKIMPGAEQVLLIAVWLAVDQVPAPPRAVKLSRKILARMQQTEFNPAMRTPPEFWYDVQNEQDALIRAKLRDGQVASSAAVPADPAIAERATAF